MSAPSLPVSGAESGAVPAPLRALARARATLAALFLLRALAVGAAAALALLAALGVLAVAGFAVRPLAAAAASLGVGLLCAALLRAREGPITTPRVALWVEERQPQLAWSLVTAADPRHEALAPLLAARAQHVAWGPLLRAAAARALTVPLVALVAALAAVLLVHSAPGEIATRRAARALGVAATVPGVPAGSALARVVVTVRPPAYTGLRARREVDPQQVAAVVGSEVRLAGDGSGVRAELRAVGDDAAARGLAVRGDGDGWSLGFAMPVAPGVVRLTTDDAERLVLLEPRPDSAPAVVLAPSVRDTVLREPTGRIALAADARDDFGLASSAFEWIVSSGEGESYTFRSGLVGEATHGNARTARLGATLAIDALQLEAGDVVHVRAVARDGNTLSGPGVGASETRTIRIARLGEGDSVAVEGAPPPALDTAALSQRMLLVRTERLEARRPRLSRDSVLADARRIAVDQTRLRRRVGELVYMRLGDEVGGEHSHFPGDGHDHGPDVKLDPEQLLARASAATGGGVDPVATDFHGDETPVVAVNRPLLEAYNHMWDATRALEIGEPAQAIPPMQRALAALQKARDAERIYLRGRPPAVVVDIARVRLQGKERGASSLRTPRDAVDDALGRRRRRFERAIVLLEQAPLAAVDSLQLLRLDALADDPALAAALDEAVRRLRGGRDATDALLRARRVAAGAPTARGALPAWGGRP